MVSGLEESQVYFSISIKRQACFSSLPCVQMRSLIIFAGSRKVNLWLSYEAFRVSGYSGVSSQEQQLLLQNTKMPSMEVMQLEEDGAEKIKIPYKQTTSWQGRNPRAPNGSEMSAFITGTLPLQRKEEVVQDGTDSWMLYWSFVCNTTNTLFIPILLYGHRVHLAEISTVFSKYISWKYSLVQRDIISFLQSEVRSESAVEVSPDSIHTWHSVFWQWVSPWDSLTPTTIKAHLFRPEHHFCMSCFNGGAWKLWL